MAMEEGELERWWSENTGAVVTGGNRGLGFGIVCELARRGLTVVLTSRDAEKGLAAVDAALKVEPKASGWIHFHQLDVTEKQSVAEMTAWLRSKFGGIDILINNPAINKFSETFEDAVVMLETNYFSVRGLTEELLPLLRPSPDGARIVNVSSRRGQVQMFEDDEYIKGQVEQAVRNLDMNVVDSLSAKYLEDLRSGRLKEQQAAKFYQYRLCRLLLNTFTRILAGELSRWPDRHKIFVNAMCPGIIDTDMTREYFEKFDQLAPQRFAKTGIKVLSVDQGGKAPVWLALMPEKNHPQGKFFLATEESSF